MKTRRPLAVALVAAALTGCSQSEIEEVWAFYLGPFATGTDTQTLSHNFTDASEPDATSSWTTDDDTAESEAIVFGEIIGLDTGETVLVINNRTFLGTADGDTTTWLWERFDNGSARSTHTAGYTYTHDYNDSQLTTIELTDGDVNGTMEGTWTVSTTTDDTWNEDDQWDTVETGQATSQIPSSNFLVKELPTGGEVPATNRTDETDCSSSPCTLSVTTNFEQSRAVSAVLTDYTADELDRTLENSGQQAGF